jgi:hypothetical protein
MVSPSTTAEAVLVAHIWTPHSLGFRVPSTGLRDE